jgi:hypothetical protein
MHGGAENFIRTIILRIRWAGHVTCMGEQEMCTSFLVVKPEGKRPIGRPRYGWEDNIKVNLEEIVWVGMDCIDVAEDIDK